MEFYYNFVKPCHGRPTNYNFLLGHCTNFMNKEYNSKKLFCALQTYFLIIEWIHKDSGSLFSWNILQNSNATVLGSTLGFLGRGIIYNRLIINWEWLLRLQMLDLCK